MLRKLITMASAAGAAAGAVAFGRHLRDIRQIRSRVERGGTLVETAVGRIEYAEAGSGEPLLMIHGAGGGYDQGLLVGRDLGPGFRVIAPFQSKSAAGSSCWTQSTKRRLHSNGASALRSWPATSAGW